MNRAIDLSPACSRLFQNLESVLNRGFVAILAVFMALLGTTIAQADAYPSKPIRFIVPYPPGGGADILARIVALRLSENIGQPVIIDNRPGAGGFAGMEAAAKASPDGYTALLGVTAYLAINPSLYSKLPYDPVKDYAPIVLMGTSSYILVVNPAVPVKTTKELIAYAKANPGKLNWGSSATASMTHLAGILFKTMAGIEMVLIPYKGMGPALTGLLTGEVQAAFGSMLSTIPHVKSGRLRALAVSGDRSQMAPDLPTVSESGVPGYYIDSSFFSLAPAGTPERIIQRLNSEFSKVLQVPEVRQRLLNDGFEVKTSTPKELANLITSERAKWAKLVKTANIRLE